MGITDGTMALMLLEPLLNTLTRKGILSKEDNEMIVKAANAKIQNRAKVFQGRVIA